MLRAGPLLTLIVLVRGSAAASGPTPTLIAGDARGSDSVQHADIQLDVTDGRGRALLAPPTFGTLIGRKAGQTMQIFAYSSDTSTNGKYGTLIDADTALRWLTVEVAFANGEIESVAAEYGLTATIATNKKSVSVSDLTGSGDTYPAGLAMTVTFTPETDMSSVFIDFSSSTTSTAVLHKDFSAHPTVSVSWTSTPRVATVVQDKSNNLYLFASPNTPTDGRASTIEIALTDAFAKSDITSLLKGMTPQVGSGFFGLGFLDGVSKLPDGEAIAVTSRPLLDIDVDSRRDAVVASPAAPAFDALIFVIGAAFFDPCGTCNAIVKKTGNWPVSYGSLCLPGDPTKTYKDGPKSTDDLVQETTECYTDIADESPAEARGGGSAGTWVGVTIGLVLALALAGLLLRARKPRYPPLKGAEADSGLES
ncbi:hypothetical protein EMIHUDRAFT_204958 [Emiliania huxleyi CCMP1516]|uniref:DOMON domain-containing protein n=2 Tax=Emiliania huxleyi TaxID=2903 RepID=A0A0D3JU80_EMIH1|nr:hypothetical protein EMIHUDRAFT_204958 [Emiliania huxleyi CCMP1516]EOD27065.1 hypothetical protein EMIHUDRAFT_204958 [Emiliania huxleyi CCMP1516]|eukprot:XP_005779494.1 hypothetical protein EMIHUDRAFT_204958 [Emiliania huxleyi CCMP1516]